MISEEIPAFLMSIFFSSTVVQLHRKSLNQSSLCLYRPSCFLQLFSLMVLLFMVSITADSLSGFRKLTQLIYVMCS